MQLVIGVDVGNTGTKVVWYEGIWRDGSFVKTGEGFHGFASEFQTFYNLTQYSQSASHFNSKTLLNNSGAVVAYNKIAYAVGTSITSTTGIEHRKDYAKYTNEYYIPMLCAAIETVVQKTQPNDNEHVDIALFCTCQITGKAEVAKWLRENAKKITNYSTLVKGNEISRSIKIDRVEVYAEPVGTAIYFLGSTQNLPNKDSDYLVIDFGGLTTDALTFTAKGNDKESIRNVQFASRPYSCNALINEVRNILVKNLAGHYNSRTPDQTIIDAILTGTTFAATKTVERLIKQVITEFLETVITSLEEELGGKQVEDYNKVILTGGGATLLGRFFTSLNNVNINNPPEEFAYNNARGAYATYNVVR